MQKDLFSTLNLLVKSFSKIRSNNIYTNLYIVLKI